MRAFSSMGLKQGMVLICRPLQQGSSPPPTVSRRRTASFLNAAAVVRFLPCHQWLWGVAFLTLLLVTHSAWCRMGPIDGDSINRSIPVGAPLVPALGSLVEDGIFHTNKKAG